MQSVQLVNRPSRGVSPCPILIYTHGLYIHSSTDAINTNPFMTVHTEDLRLDILQIYEAKEQQSSAKAGREVTSVSLAVPVGVV